MRADILPTRRNDRNSLHTPEMTAPVLAAIAFVDTLAQNALRLRQAAAHLEQYRQSGETTIEAAARIMADELRRQNK